MYYHTDRLGSPMTITDRHGEPVVRYAWDAYGRAMAGVFEPYNTVGFSGKMRDGATGLTYFGARWYDAESGKFLSRDPIRDGWNWHAYVGGDPVNFVDPWGLIATEAENEPASEKTQGSATKVPIVGIGATIVFGAGVDVAVVTDSKGRGGVAISVSGGAGLEAKVPIPGFSPILSAITGQSAATATGIETKPGTIHEFEGTGREARVHAIAGLRRDIVAKENNFSLSPTVGGGAYGTYTEVIQLWGPE
jgi:RHS repeat-associated protein